MNICIMIVDDDVDDVEMFIEAVHEISPDIPCIRAFNGLEALNLINSVAIKPQYIFVDLNMPKMNGKQFIAEIRKNSTFDGIKTIIYSTSKMFNDERDTKLLGADEFITKPTSFEELVVSISRVILMEYKN